MRYLTPLMESEYQPLHLKTAHVNSLALPDCMAVELKSTSFLEAINF